jgi:glycosyltransferase involved in cell wall biosynthesis
MSKRRPLVFVWEQFGPYHIDRCNAVARALGQHRVIGIEIAETSPSHLWDHPPAPTEFQLITLFKGVSTSHARPKVFFRLLQQLWRLKPGLCFVCHYDRWEILFASIMLRLSAIPVVTMQESKFDDKPRNRIRELLKSCFLLPYAGAMVGGARGRAYMEFLGFRAAAIAEGYDTVSVDRIASLADLPPAPDGRPYQERHFTIIARLVEKKNLAMAVDAYAIYRRLAGEQSRELHICGDGPLRAALEAQVAQRRLEGVVFCGILQPEAVPPKLARSLALVLPSTEEQWGLVANEAVALGVPLLLSTNCGAGDSLLRSGVNGFLYEPFNPDGLAYFMDVLGRDESLWRRMSQASLELRPVADTLRFGKAVTYFLDRLRAKAWAEAAACRTGRSE